MAKPVVLDKEFKANSLLIASAPDMLDLLKELIGYDVPDKLVNRTLKIIRKVEGQ